MKKNYLQSFSWPYGKPWRLNSLTSSHSEKVLPRLTVIKHKATINIQARVISLVRLFKKYAHTALHLYRVKGNSFWVFTKLMRRTTNWFAKPVEVNKNILVWQHQRRDSVIPTKWFIIRSAGFYTQRIRTILVSYWEGKVFKNFSNLTRYSW